MPVPFIWPGFLWGLLLVPAVLALYVRQLRRALPAALPHPVTPPVAITATDSDQITNEPPPRPPPPPPPPPPPRTRPPPPPQPRHRPAPDPPGIPPRPCDAAIATRGVTG